VTFVTALGTVIGGATAAADDDDWAAAPDVAALAGGPLTLLRGDTATAFFLARAAF
jgi:hypothetical protein